MTAGLGFDRFETITTRRVTRAAEMEGGSVYFVRSGTVLFRMPFLEVVDLWGGEWAIVMRPELIRTERKRVGMVRGWRYMANADAPPDLPRLPLETDELPEHMRKELEELGL